MISMATMDLSTYILCILCIYNIASCGFTKYGIPPVRHSCYQYEADHSQAGTITRREEIHEPAKRTAENACSYDS